jgi:hypothetical protein
VLECGQWIHPRQSADAGHGRVGDHPVRLYNGDGIRTSKTVAGDTREYALDVAASLPVVISDTEAVYLYGLDR